MEPVSELNKRIEARDIDLPPEKPLPEDSDISPYFIVGDDAFALRSYLHEAISESSR